MAIPSNSHLEKYSGAIRRLLIVLLILGVSPAVIAQTTSGLTGTSPARTERTID